MKTTSIFRPSHTFAYWRPVITLDPTGEEMVSFEFVANRKGIFVPKMGMSNLICPEQMDVDGEIRGLRDNTGTLISIVDGNEYVFFVASADPVLDGFGRLVAWNHTIRRSA